MGTKKQTSQKLEPMPPKDMQTIIREINGDTDDMMEEIHDMTDFSTEEKEAIIRGENAEHLSLKMQEIFGNEIDEIVTDTFEVCAYLISGYYVRSYIPSKEILDNESIQRVSFEIGTYTIQRQLQKEESFLYTFFNKGDDKLKLKKLLSL